MQPRNTLILLVVALAFGSYLWFVEIGGEEERRSAEQAEHALFSDLEADAIDAIVLATSDGQSARLVREDGVWMLVEPLRFRADATNADATASGLAGLVSEAVFDEPEPLANYGLEGEPIVRFEAGGESYALRVGDKTPVGGNTYIAREGDPRVFTVPTWRTNAFRRSLDDLRDRRILDVDTDAVRSLDLSWPEGAVSLVRQEGAWRLSQPLDAPADGDAVRSLLSSLSFLSADSFVDDPPGAAEAGLETPAFSAKLGLADGAVRTVAIGASDGTNRLVAGDTEGVLYRIAAARLDDFPRAVAAYRMRDVSKFPIADARRFDLVFDGLVVEGVRGEDGWQTTPEPMAPGTASRLVTELSHLVAKDIAADELGEDEARALGLAPPRATLRVRGGPEESDDDLLAEVRLGAAEPGHGIAAQRSDQPTVYWLDLELGEHLPLGTDAFRNRFVAEEQPQPEGAEPDADSGPEASVPAEAPEAALPPE